LTKDRRTSDSPSFSIVLETENLAKTEFEKLSSCLDSLAHQDLPPNCANEVLLVESGNAPHDELEALIKSYPWISIHKVKPETDYYEAKTEGTRVVTGEIVVFCDSDVIYESGWLRNLLMPFSQNSDIQVVAGETSLSITGPYSLAMALTWPFPPFSDRKELYESSNYLANNVAFRHDFIIRYPIPSEPHIYRGSCAIHAAKLRRLGHRIWRQPQARALHPMPARGLSQYFWRHLLRGHDHLLQERLSRELSEKHPLKPSWYHDLMTLLKIISFGTMKPIRRLPADLREKPHSALFLPLTVCIILSSMLIVLFGHTVAYFRPGALLEHVVEKLESK